MNYRAKRCPHCGAKKGKSRASNLFSTILKIIAIIVIGFIILVVRAHRETPEVAEVRNLSKSEFVEACQEIDYKDLIRYEDKYEGSYIKITVQLTTTADPLIYYGRAREENSFDDIGWFGDQYCIFDQREEDQTKLLDDDFVTVYGIFTGCGSDDMPILDAVYIDLLDI